MNSGPATLLASLPLTQQQFDQLFPFHLVVSADDRIVQFGSGLPPVCPGLAVGRPFGDLLVVYRPVSPTLAGLDPAHFTALVLLQIRDRELLLRGQVLALAGGNILFVGSPWITEAADVQRHGLMLETFAIHDASLDIIHAAQAQRMAMDDHRRLVERLSAQRAELQAANAQLRLREAEASKLALVAARTHGAVVITDRHARIEWVNEGFERLTGYRVAECVGRKPGELLQGPETSRATLDFIRDKLRNCEGFNAELVNYARDGRRYWVDIEVQPVFGPDGVLTNFIAIEQDITARVDAEWRHRLQQSVSGVLAETDALEQGISLVVRAMATAFGARYSACWIVQGGLPQSEPIALWGDGAHGADAPEQTLAAGLHGLLGQFGAADGPVQCSLDNAGSGPTAAFGSSALFVPCRVEGRLIGELLLTGNGMVVADRATMDLLRLLGHQLGQFIARKLAKRELQRSRDFALQVMSLMGQGLTVTDEHGKLTYVNKKFTEMSGQSPESLLGRSPHELSESEDQGTLAEARQRRRHGEASFYEVSLVRPDGQVLPVLISGVPRFEKGRFAGSVAVITDLSSQKRVEQQMAAALARERELNALKSSFVTMASHEFRTPLTAIVYAAEMLGSAVATSPDPNTSRCTKYVSIVLDGAKRMSDLMNDLLLLGRIESGRLGCNPVPVELADFVRELKGELGMGQARVVLRLAPDLPAQALLDTTLLRHALLNLLTNALKYSPDMAEVTLALSVETADVDSVWLCFEVQDHGRGIPEADQKRLFQAFFRASNVGKIRGTGIGLTIARDCTRLHGGELSFESRPDVGTRFTLRIPFRAPPL
jgi:PAS domain S-box-containing protein